MALIVTHPFVCALADDPVADAAGEVVPSDWNADHTIVVTSLTIATGTITASEPVLDLSQTWNNAAVTFTGVKLNVTNTASAAASKLQDWQVGGTSVAWLRRGGQFVAYYGSAASPAFELDGVPSGTGFYGESGQYRLWISINGTGNTLFDGNGFSTAGRIGVGGASIPAAQLYAPASYQLELRNGTNAQTFRVYGTYTDSSNYVRAALSSSSTAVTLAAETAGTGADNVPVNITPAGTEGVQIGNFAQLTEMTAPAAGASNTARIFAEDNGSGKTRLMVQFASGAAQQIAIEP